MIELVPTNNGPMLPVFSHGKKISNIKKKEIIQSDGLNNIQYSIKERKQINDYVEMIIVDI